MSSAAAMVTAVATGHSIAPEGLEQLVSGTGDARPLFHLLQYGQPLYGDVFGTEGRDDVCCVR